MAARRRQVARISTRSGALALALSFSVVVAGCSWSRLDETSTGESSAGPTIGEMRTVPPVPSAAPTVPSSPTSVPAPGEEGAAPGAVSSDTPSDTQPVPMTTEVLGDPQPDPDSDVTLPPLPDAPIVAACTRLAELRAAEQFGTASAVATTESLGELGCRFTSGPAVAEIHYLSEDVIESDWFRREAIEPVGEVTSDAVGVAVFATPGSDADAGYTIALVSRREGAVIAVRGTPDDRAVAVQLANIVESST